MFDNGKSELMGCASGQVGIRLLVVIILQVGERYLYSGRREIERQPRRLRVSAYICVNLNILLYIIKHGHIQTYT